MNFFMYKVNLPTPMTFCSYIINIGADFWFYQGGLKLEMKNNYIPISLNYQLRTQFGSLINDVLYSIH